MTDLAALFPGQGSQEVGMGRELAEAFAEARHVFERADEALGLSLSRIAWEGPERDLVATENAQPAILVHSYAVWTVVQPELDGRVRFAAGHSLGEFSAYAAAGVLAFEDAIRLVRHRGELMARSGAERPGTMSAIVGMEPAAVEEVCRRAAAEGGVVVAANFNSPKQIVISGEVVAVERAEELAREAGARLVRRLSVSGAFHSPLMEPAEDGLRSELEALAFSDPEFPVVANATAEPVDKGDRARELLVRQLTSPVRWTESVQRIAEAGVRSYVEFGPGEVLTGLLKRIDSGLVGTAVGDAEGVRRLKEREG